MIRVAFVTSTISRLPCPYLQGFHHEREDRGLVGHGAAHAPRGPPSHLGPAGIRMLQVLAVVSS